MSALFPMCPITYVSRITHTLGGALLFAHALAPYVFEGPLTSKVHKHFFSAAGVLVAAAGILNAILLKPKQMQERAGPWRAVVYGGKLTFLALMTPLSDALFGEAAKVVKVAAGISAFMSGAWARFYREKHTVKSN